MDTRAETNVVTEKGKVHREKLGLGTFSVVKRPENFISSLCNVLKPTRGYQDYSAPRCFGAKCQDCLELSDIHHKLEHRELHVDFDCIGSVNVNDSNILSWECTIYPKEAPYDKAGFKIKLEFPAEYPFKPPKLTFATKIYHPNIDEKGQVCLPIISPDNWKPATKTDQVLVSLVKLIHEPELEHPLRGDLAEEYSRNFKKFAKSAEEWAKKYGLERK